MTDKWDGKERRRRKLKPNGSVLFFLVMVVMIYIGYADNHASCVLSKRISETDRGAVVVILQRAQSLHDRAVIDRTTSPALHDLEIRQYHAAIQKANAFAARSHVKCPSLLP